LDREREVTESRRLARQAASIAPDDAVTLGFSGFALAQAARELEDGAGLIERALHLNPNLGPVMLASGWVNVWLGEPELAIEHLAQAMRLSPLDPHMYMMQNATAHAHFFAGRLAPFYGAEKLSLWPFSRISPALRKFLRPSE
jgi:adenylate cyclase